LLKGVLDIVSGDPFVSACSEGELEIELDQLKPETLWKLHALVASKPAPAAQSKPAAPPPPSKVQAAEKKPPASAQTSGTFIGWDSIVSVSLAHGARCKHFICYTSQLAINAFDHLP
jgi:hypothetical protein